MSDHGAAIWSSAQEARPRGHVAHEPRRALIIPESETDVPSEPNPSLPNRISAGAEQQRVKMRQRIARPRVFRAISATAAAQTSSSGMRMTSSS